MVYLGGQAHHVVELAVLGALDERAHLVDRVDESGAVGEARVAHGDPFAIRQLSQFDAVAAIRAASLRLAPGEARRQLVGRNSVTERVHDRPFAVVIVTVTIHHK